jgi:hypothetical protein
MLQQTMIVHFTIILDLTLLSALECTFEKEMEDLAVNENVFRAYLNRRVCIIVQGVYFLIASVQTTPLLLRAHWPKSLFVSPSSFGRMS